jgi:hypothetical protein
MTRPVNAPGYQSKAERDLAAGLTVAKQEQIKAKAAAKKAQEAKDKANSLKGVKKQIELLEIEKKRQSALRTYYQNAFNTASLANPQNPTLIASLKTSFINTTNEISKIEANIRKKNDEVLVITTGRTASENYILDGRARVQKALADAKKAKGTGSKDTKPPVDKKPPATMRFNAPMVTSAYFRTKTPSTNSLLAQGAIPKSAASLIDTLSTFGDGDTNRGFIVPNKRAQEAALSSLDDKSKAIVGGFKIPFGFRFHYNPQFVTQSYGSITGISPELIESGKDKANMITTPASSSAISITLYLNRIEDMNALGGVSGSVNTTTLEGIATASAAKRPGKAINSDADSKLYYPEVVPAEDRQLIKDFGTMYDLDFLFKAINGDMGGYKSPLRGVTTGDVGWLNGIAVEVHMGRKLRYLARVTNISVNHVQFTENMVPTLTTVVLTMARFHDAMVKD